MSKICFPLDWQERSYESRDKWCHDHIFCHGVGTWGLTSDYKKMKLAFRCALCPDMNKRILANSPEEILDHIASNEHQENLVMAKLEGKVVCQNSASQHNKRVRQKKGGRVWQ